LSLLLDTNACVAVMNDRPHARARLKQAYARRDIVFVSTIVLFELWFGVVKSGRQTHNANRLSDFLSAMQILEFDGDDARVAATVRLSLMRAGTPIGSYDLLIASQAIRHEFSLVTANTRELSRVPDLRLENWEA
jgi:tRNA(fMet)-specific endonuclease VapC